MKKVGLVKIKPGHIRLKNLGEKHFNGVNSFHVNCRGSFSNDLTLIRLIRLFEVNKVNTSVANARLNGLVLAYIYKPTEIDSTSVSKRWDASGHRRIAFAFTKE